MAEFTPINTQEELDKVIASRIQRERDTVSKQFQTQISERDQKITGFESQIAELNKQIETFNGQSGRMKELEDKVRAYETSSAKMRIARETGLPMELAERISGADEAAMKSDAEDLAKLIRARSAPAPMYRQNGEGGNDSRDAALKDLLKKVRNE